MARAKALRVGRLPIPQLYHFPLPLPANVAAESGSPPPCSCERADPARSSSLSASSPPGQVGRMGGERVWGCIFAEGAESPTSWRPDMLGPGARVGLLVTASSDEVFIFVDGKPVVSAQNVKLASKEMLYPVVDVFSAARSLTLRQHAAVPPPPWALPSEPTQRQRPSESVRSPCSVAETISIGGCSLTGGSHVGSNVAASAFSIRH